MSQKKVKARRKANTPTVTMLSGDDAVKAFSDLLARMDTNPENFVFFDEEESTDYMCTTCAMPAHESLRLSECSGAPVVYCGD